VSEQRAAMNPDYLYQLKWYYWPRCPLLPDYRFKPGDKYNEWNFHFNWLIFRAWTMMSPDIGIEIQLDDQQLMIRARIPYLIFGLFIPIFPFSWHQKLWRYPRMKGSPNEK
jgi:hypothetical protein